MALLLKPLCSGLRRMVSGDKQRFDDGRFNLDLTYITDRIIGLFFFGSFFLISHLLISIHHTAMGFPSEGVEGTYRNPIEEVAAMLDTYHAGHYTIYNLAGRDYDYTRFGSRVNSWCGFPDHHPPPLGLLVRILLHMHDWLRSDARNVAVVHCLAGKGRTGTVIASYLLVAGLFASARDALSYFALKRSSCNNGVTVPGQRRYVAYVADVLARPALPPLRRVWLLRAVVLRGVPVALGLAPALTVHALFGPRRHAAFASLWGDPAPLPVSRAGQCTLSYTTAPHAATTPGSSRLQKRRSCGSGSSEGTTAAADGAGGSTGTFTSGTSSSSNGTSPALDEGELVDVVFPVDVLVRGDVLITLDDRSRQALRLNFHTAWIDPSASEPVVPPLLATSEKPVPQDDSEDEDEDEEEDEEEGDEESDENQTRSCSSSSSIFIDNEWGVDATGGEREDASAPVTAPHPQLLGVVALGKTRSSSEAPFVNSSGNAGTAGQRASAEIAKPLWSPCVSPSQQQKGDGAGVSTTTKETPGHHTVTFTKDELDGAGVHARFPRDFAVELVLEDATGQLSAADRSRFEKESRLEALLCSSLRHVPPPVDGSAVWFPPTPDSPESVPVRIAHARADSRCQELLAASTSTSTGSSSSGSSSDMCGWLVKQGQKVHSWKRRWFVLRGGVLEYYASPRDARPRGAVALASVCAVVPDVLPAHDPGDHPYCFQLVVLPEAPHAGGRTLVISAPDDSARVEWVESIELARMSSRNATVSAVCDATNCSHLHSPVVLFMFFFSRLFFADGWAHINNNRNALRRKRARPSPARASTFPSDVQPNNLKTTQKTKHNTKESFVHR